MLLCFCNSLPLLVWLAKKNLVYVVLYAKKNDVLLSDAPFMCVALEGNCMHSLILAAIAIGLWAIAGLLAHHAAADRALQCSS
ncbi:hypothetical protein [Janthinobacterium sp.]|uniref:hypothetical protein n=1 Tax=Janthinobacterium sp. TaxID=1871054 RepID=UPI0025B8231D|nr:hypothetical protein [Janthinobacterium sp.]